MCVLSVTLRRIRQTPNSAAAINKAVPIVMPTAAPVGNPLPDAPVAGGAVDGVWGGAAGGGGAVGGVGVMGGEGGGGSEEQIKARGPLHLALFHFHCGE